ncbi:MAG: hypothetical protein ACJ77K_09175 [Bacteroidia bacterium]
MRSFFQKRYEILYPGDREQVFALTKKWKITEEQLTEAILETGSVHTGILHDYLVNSGQVFSFRRLIHQLINKQ